MSLHHFNEQHIDLDCSDLSGEHKNELFYNCVFNRLKGLTLKGCFLNGSRFVTARMRDALGFTLTLDCNSFRNVEYSPTLFNLLLCLITMTKGNDSKRQAVAAIVGDEYQDIIRILGRLE